MPNTRDIHSRLLDDISRDLSSEPNFPTCMDAATLVRDTLKDPEASLARVVRVVGIEPLICSKVLRLANSVAHNPAGKPVTELGAAISRLGFETVRTISLAVALDQMLKTPRLAVFSTLAKQAWEHSLEVAAISRVLARHIGRINADEAMLAGLVRDIGVFYLLYRAASQAEYCQDEALLLALLKGWHTVIGEKLLTTLGLPVRIVDTLHDYNHLQNAENPCSLHDVLYFANLLSGSEMPWQTAPDDSIDQAVRQADTARYADLLAEARDDIRELHSALAA